MLTCHEMLSRIRKFAVESMHGPREKRVAVASPQCSCRWRSCKESHLINFAVFLTMRIKTPICSVRDATFSIRGRYHSNSSNCKTCRSVGRRHSESRLASSHKTQNTPCGVLSKPLACVNMTNHGATQLVGSCGGPRSGRRTS